MLLSVFILMFFTQPHYLLEVSISTYLFFSFLFFCRACEVMYICMVLIDIKSEQNPDPDPDPRPSLTTSSIPSYLTIYINLANSIIIFRYSNMHYLCVKVRLLGLEDSTLIMRLMDDYLVVSTDKYERSFHRDFVAFYQLGMVMAWVRF